MKSLKEKHENEVVPELMKEFGWKNKLEAPEIEKVVVNLGFGKRIKEMSGKKKEEFLSLVTEDLSLITGQKPVFTRARKSISGFELQKGKVIGAKVTLHNRRMYDFLDRLIHIALPRSRDFRGIRKESVDQAGNLSIGLREQTVFPEVDVETLKDDFSFQVTVKTDTQNREQALRMFELLGVPFRE